MNIDTIMNFDDVEKCMHRFMSDVEFERKRKGLKVRHDYVKDNVYNFYKLHTTLSRQGEKNTWLSHITELNLMYELLMLHPDLIIDHEPSDDGNIDIKARLADDLFYISVKHSIESAAMIRKKLNRKKLIAGYLTRKQNRYIKTKKLKEYLLDWASIDDLEQVYQALLKAVGSITKTKEPGIKLIAHEISSKADIDNIAIGEALYGRETFTYHMNPFKQPEFSRTQGIAYTSFFYTESGQQVDGYIALRAMWNVQDYYEKALFVNPNSKADIEKIKKLIPCDKVYYYNSFIQELF